MFPAKQVLPLEEIIGKQNSVKLGDLI